MNSAPFYPSETVMRLKWKYIIQVKTEYQLIVNKSGAQLGTVTRASIDVMDKALLEIYNEQNGKRLSIIPEDCYVFNGDKQIEFGP